MAYWEDLDANAQQTMWTESGGSVNIHGMVFGSDYGAGANNNWNAISVGQNDGRVYSPAIMAGFLGKLN